VSLRREEFPHHSREQIVDYARDAVAIADELALEGADRDALLPIIAGFLAAKQINFIAPQMLAVDQAALLRGGRPRQ
jgi:hypothetical protein